MIADLNNKKTIRISYWSYYKIFSSEFNIKTKKLRQDVCDICASLQTQIKNLKTYKNTLLKPTRKSY